MHRTLERAPAPIKAASPAPGDAAGVAAAVAPALCCDAVRARHPVSVEATARRAAAVKVAVFRLVFRESLG
jgi:hypothetical protein